MYHEPRKQVKPSIPRPDPVYSFKVVRSPCATLFNIKQATLSMQTKSEGVQPNPYLAFSKAQREAWSN